MEKQKLGTRVKIHHQTDQPLKNQIMKATFGTILQIIQLGIIPDRIGHNRVFLPVYLII